LLLASALLYAGVALLYLPTVGAALISLDDYGSVREFTGRSWGELWGHDHFGHFRPLKNVLFWWVARATSDGLASVRLAIVALHVVLVAIVQRAVTRDCSPWVGLSAAALWSVHPSTATVVGWLSAANLASCLFGVLVYLLCAEQASTGRSPRLHGALALLGLGVGLFSHELAFVGPVLLAAWRSRSTEKQTWTLVAVGSATLLLVYTTLRWLSQASLPSYRVDAEPRWALLLNAPRYLLTNLSLWLWPFDRFGVLLRDTPTEHVVAAVLGWLALALLTALCWKLGKRDLSSAFGAVWAMAFLIPVCNFLPFGNTPVAVHYLYLPGVGLALIAAQATARAARSLRARAGPRLVLSLRIALPGLTVLTVTALWLDSRRVLQAWSDEERLYELSHDNYPDGVEVMANLSSVYMRQKRYREAENLLGRARASAPRDPILLENTLDLLLETERPHAVLSVLDEVPELRGRVELSIREGQALQQLGRHPEAAASYQRAFTSADLATMPEERLRAGYQAIIELLRSGRGAEARGLLAQLLTEYPARSELQIAKQLLGANE
jgi:hypothetical protein